jgi:hypothetical protein
MNQEGSIMADTKTTMQRWNDFRPTKTQWLWSCVGSVVATVIVGFWFGGWVTGGSASSMSEGAATSARAELAANICVDRFVNDPEFGAELALLKDASRFQRGRLLEEAGWTTLQGTDTPVANAAALCSEMLVAMEAPAAIVPAVDTATPAEPATVTQ